VDRPTDLAELFSTSDICFTAGGDVMYELACVGTPALVLYEDIHEKEQAVEFRNSGFGILIGAGARIRPGPLQHGLKRMNDPVARRAHAHAGQAAVDGNGAQRILGVIQSVANR
jgi:spore coat polysaccharide biosynthesis predicted glycosyltransferase SpsG